MTAIYPDVATALCEGFSLRSGSGHSDAQSTHSTLRTWGLQLRERISCERAAVAVARKLAVIMHTMLKTGELLNPNAGAAA